MKKLFYSKKAAPYVFVLPFVLTFLFFWIGPVVNGFRLSFWDTLQEKNVGWANYSRLMTDTIFWKAVKNSAVYTIWTLILLIPFPLLLAVLLNSRFAKKPNIFKSIYFIPALTSVVVAGTIFRLMFGESDQALLNSIIGLFGHAPVAWLKHGNTAMFALLALCCWRWTGVNTMYFIAGIQAIPQDLYEAAEVDGASKAQQFWKITIPLVKPTTIYVLTISIYAGLSMFLESFMLWKGNNSPNNIGLTIVGYLYREGIEKSEMGYACAVGIVLLIIIMVVNVIQLKLNGTFDKEEE